jgi:hypothetical protein
MTASQTHVSPYTKAYTENLVASLERTRDELKDMIADLYTKADVRNLPTAKRVAGQMHRMVGSISDDLDG